MRRVLIVVAGVSLGLWLSRPADGGELKVATVQGANIKTFTGAPGGKYSFQCPNIDAGAGQKVFYRPGCPARADAGVQCVTDAGLGDVMVDFTNNLDPYKVDLAPNEDRIHFAAADGYAIAVWCTVYRRSPP